MIRRLGFCLAMLIGMSPASRADDKPALEPGNYIVYYAFQSTGPDQAYALIKVEKQGDKLAATLLDSPPQLKSTLKDFTANGRKVKAVFDLGGRILSFEGLVEAKNAKSALGSFGDESLPARGRMGSTENDKIGQTDLNVAAKTPESMTKASALSGNIARLKNKLRFTKGDDAKAEVQKQIDAAEKEFQEKAPALYRELIEQQPSSHLVVDAVIGLLRASPNIKEEEGTKLVKMIEALNDIYGERFTLTALVQCGSGLAGQKGLEKVALGALEKAAKLAEAQAGFETKMRILRAMHSVHDKAGQADLAKAADAKIDALYTANIPPFKPTVFEGRKKKSERVAVLELFTGAQCPPCVAADVAFDALLKAYKPTELVMMQYHMHIPGPDPLTNADTESRWKYYVKPMTPAGVPYSIVNGKPEGRGGGGMGASEAKFKEFRGYVDPILETENTIKLAGNVTRKDDKIAIKIDVAGIPEDNPNLMLRMALVEESVKYVGGNGIRFHHHVVRTMPGGVEGTALNEKAVSKTAEVDLAALRKKLRTYLDDFEATGREFSNPDKPLAFKDLRVIAFVQDDGTKEILQAVQLDVPEGK